MCEANVAKLKRVYWDSCAWLGLINGEPNKRRELEIIYNAAKRGDYEILTSTISLIEVNRFDYEKDKKKPLEIGNTEKLQQMFEQPFVKLATLDLRSAAPHVNFSERHLALANDSMPLIWQLHSLGQLTHCTHTITRICFT